MNVTDTTTKPAAHLAILILPIVTLLVNIPAIILLIWSTCRKELMKNVHLLSVGITDTLVGIAALLMAKVYLDRTDSLSYYNCSIRFLGFSVTFVASLLHILGICVQRVRIVFKKETPQQHENNRRLTEWLVIALSWIVSVLVNAIPYGLWAKYREIDHCSFESVYDQYVYDISIYAGVLYCFIIMMVLLAMGILCRQICTKGQFHGNQTSGSKDVKLCITIIIMAVLFVVTTSPLAFVLMITGKGQELRKIAVQISVMNSAINPFVYLYRIKENRDKLRKAMSCFYKSSCCKPPFVNVENAITTNTANPRNTACTRNTATTTITACKRNMANTGKMAFNKNTSFTTHTAFTMNTAWATSTV